MSNLTERPESDSCLATLTPTQNCQLADNFGETYGQTKNGSGRRKNTGSRGLEFVGHPRCKHVLVCCSGCYNCNITVTCNHFYITLSSGITLCILSYLCIMLIRVSCQNPVLPAYFHQRYLCPVLTVHSQML